MSEELEGILPEEEEQEIPETEEEIDPIAEEVPIPSEDTVPNFEEQENLISQIPTDVYSQEQQVDDQVYQESLNSRGKEKIEDIDLAKR